MRHISFSLTTPQFLDGTKTITRRLGWRNLNPGDLLCAVEKSQGLKKGETVRRLGTIRVVSVRREQIGALVLYGSYGLMQEMIAEGFPGMSSIEFVNMFCAANKCKPNTEITRIEFDRCAP